MVELLVAMVCSLLIFAIVVSSFFAAVKFDNNRRKDMEILENVFILHDKILKYPDDNYILKEDNKVYVENEDKPVVDIEITDLRFPEDEHFRHCHIRYKDASDREKTLTFIVVRLVGSP